MTDTGHLLAFEGIDGSGKGTQARLLFEALSAMGRDTELFAFPAYQHTLAGHLIGTYLNGGLGDPKSIDSHLTAMLYAVDRFEMKERLRSALQAGKTVICDRYVDSNLAHQAARASSQKRAALRKFIHALEYDVFGLPRPNLVILLDMPVRLAQARVLMKAASSRKYTRKKMDAAEADAGHLKRSLREYRQAAAHSDNWCLIPTTQGRRERTPEEIHADILKAALEVLSPDAPLS